MIPFDDAWQICTAILNAEGPLICDQYGTCRRLRAVVAIIDSHTDGGSIALEENKELGVRLVWSSDAEKETEDGK